MTVAFRSSKARALGIPAFIPHIANGLWPSPIGGYREQRSRTFGFFQNPRGFGVKCGVFAGVTIGDRLRNSMGGEVVFCLFFERAEGGDGWGICLGCCVGGQFAGRGAGTAGPKGLVTAVISICTGWGRGTGPVKGSTWEGGLRGPKKGSDPFSTSGNGDFSVNFLHVFRAQN